MLGEFIRLTRRLGIFEALQLNLWRVKTYFYKHFLLWQESSHRYTYQDWIRQKERQNSKLDESKSSPTTVHTPLFSILIPVLLEKPVLGATLESLQEQKYSFWEAWVVYNPNYLSPIDFKESEKIHFISFDPGVINSDWDAFKSVRAKVPGEFLLWAEPGDQLSPDLLLEVVHQIDLGSNGDIYYWDEDQLSVDPIHREKPLFKPDWSPELMLSKNYLQNSAIRLDLIRKVHAVSYPDALFRCIELDAKAIHIPKALYHKHPGSRDHIEEHCKAVKSHLERSGLVEVTVNANGGGIIHAAWKNKASLVSIIIPTKDHFQEIKRSVSTILAMTRYPNYELVLMDTGNTQSDVIRYFDELRSRNNLRILTSPGPFNYSATMNQGALAARGDLLLFLNNDIEIIDPDWLDEMVQWAERPEIGVVGACLLHPDRTIQHAGLILGMEGYASHIFMGMPEHSHSIFGSTHWYRDYMALNGACLMVRKAVFEQIGGFDENFRLAFSDVKLGIEARKLGYRNLYNPFVRLIHFEGKSRGNLIPREDIRAGYPYFRQVVEGGDPYYNLNLSYTVRIPILARPGEESPMERIDKIAQLRG